MVSTTFEWRTLHSSQASTRFRAGETQQCPDRFVFTVVSNGCYDRLTSPHEGSAIVFIGGFGLGTRIGGFEVRW